MKSYQHFTFTERESLYSLYKEKKSIRAIAQELGRSPSSISRELKRNLDRDGRYNACNATFHYIRRRENSKRKLRFADESELKTWTIERLKEYWPPETIVAIWKRNHPGAKLSHNTIYRALKSHLLPGCAARTHLRRRNVLKYKKGNRATIRPDCVIAQRPEVANQRQRIGDWEGDTLRGAVGKGCLTTFVDRKSRYLTAAISDGMSAQKVGAALVSALQGLPVHTLTLDRGSEFASFRTFQETLRATVYFADPHSPWQRGSNENMNDHLRFFFAKGYDFRSLQQEYLDYVLLIINSRPRKCLGWLSPIDFLSKCCT